MGSYLVQNSTEFDDADEIQAHCKNVISPRESTGSLSMGFGGPVHYLGALRESKNDEQTRNEFFRHAKEDLVGNEWAARIKEPLQNSKFGVIASAAKQSSCYKSDA